MRSRCADPLSKVDGSARLAEDLLELEDLGDGHDPDEGVLLQHGQQVDVGFIHQAQHVARDTGGVGATSAMACAHTARDRRTGVSVNRADLAAGDRAKRAERARATYDIFEGTEQIQQLVIARAISGMRIE